MKHRNVKIAVLRAGERTRVTRGGSYLIFTDLAIREFVQGAPSATPWMTDHSGSVEHRIGHVANYAVEVIDGAATLIANAVLTDLAVEVRKDQHVSLGVEFATEHTRMGEDGYRRVNRFSARECSLLTEGTPGAMRSARVLEVGPIVGRAEQSAMADQSPAATRWRAGGGTWGHSVVSGSIETVG